ncbi:DUF3080 family protein [Nitrincola alkalilacustris]|uniref:DUF3080 family protein n=1 Tax=Nitrincola alkalilacustris TaxID=1571224 RepID=UPI00124CCD38|nr:DUF3080 family protein [Nitrincola alkalilacustris]
MIKVHEACLILLAVLTAGTISGCSEPTPEKMMQTYAQRLGNALDQPVEYSASTLQPLPSQPPRRQRLLPVTEIREGLFDVLNLRHCNLLPLVAQRNSSLGRVMPPSQQLIYELQFLQAIAECEDLLHALITKDLDLEEEFKGVLQQISEIHRIKRDNLPAVIWNSLYTAPEMEKQFAINQPPLPLNNAGLFATIEPSLEMFARISSQTQPGTDFIEAGAVKALEQDYERLYRSDFGAQLLKSLLHLTHLLDAAADAIESRLERLPVCYNGRPNPQAEILRNVFTRFYAQEIQGYLATVHQQGIRWLELQQQIMAPLPIPDSTAPYYRQVVSTDSPNSLWQAYTAARDRHTSAWQQLLGQCGMMPGLDQQSAD